MRNQATLGGVENSDFILRQQAQTYTVSEHLNKGFIGYLKGSSGHQVTKMCSGYWG
jgi:hypothetical protein